MIVRRTFFLTVLSALLAASLCVPVRAAQTIVTADAMVNGQTIHYLRAGSGDAIVLVHGYPEDSTTWRRVMPLLAKYGTVIAPDTRGTGNSSMSATMHIRDAADDLYQLVHRLGFRRVVLVGQDFGVQIVSAYAALHRQDIRALIVAESPLSGYGLEALYAKYWHFGFLASPYASMLIGDNAENFFRSFAFGGFVYNKAAFPPAYVQAYIDAEKRPGRLDAGFAYYRALQTDEGFFRKTVPPTWTFPVLTLDAEHGLHGLTATSFRRVANRVQAITVPGSGHFVQEENPAFVAAAIRSFLRAYSSPSQ